MKLATLVAVAVCSIGCGKKKGGAEADFKELRDTRGAAVLAMCTSVAAAAAKLAPLTADKVDGASKLATGEAGNTFVITEPLAVDLATKSMTREDGSAPQPGDDLLDGLSEQLQLCRWLMDPTMSEPHEMKYERAVHALDRTKQLGYVVATHILEYTAPKVEADGFVPGHVHGEVHVLDVKGVDHGGFRFEAASSDQVAFQSTTLKNGKSQDDAATMVKRDLTDNLQKALDAGVAKYLPGSNVTILVVR